MEWEELLEIKIMAMQYDDPIRGKTLALVTIIELMLIEIENLRRVIKETSEPNPFKERQQVIQASLTHKTALLRFNEAETEEKKMQLAYNYFLSDALVVDREFQKELTKHVEGIGD